ncbi:MAG: hypothetical protein ABIL09_12365 [Gemmatimonadota bacterium]
MGWLTRGGRHGDGRSGRGSLYGLLLAAGAVLVGLDGLDLMGAGLHKHGHYAVEGWFAFQAGLGALAGALLLLAGWAWRLLVGRDDEYYEEAGGDA